MSDNRSNAIRIPKGSKTLILGQSLFGKTSLIHEMVEISKKDFAIVWAFCATTKVSKSYSWNKPFTYALDGLSEEEKSKEPPEVFVKMMVRAQQVIAKEWRAASKAGPEIPVPASKSMLIILDDVLGQGMNFYDDEEWWGSLLSDMRHYGLSIIFSVQTIHKALPPSVRSQFDRVAIFYNSSSSEAWMDIVPRMDNPDGTPMKRREIPEAIRKLTSEKYSFVLFDAVRMIYGINMRTRPMTPFKITYGVVAKKK